MKWRKGLPTEPGFYWFRYHKATAEHRHDVLEIRLAGDGSLLWFDWATPNCCWRPLDGCGFDKDEWYGPIPPPGGDA